MDIKYPWLNVIVLWRVPNYDKDDKVLKGTVSTLLC